MKDKGKEKEIKELIRKIIADRLDIDIKKVKREAILINDLGMDSFGAVELTFELKDKFGIEIPREEFKNIRTVEDIFKHILTRLD